MSEEGIDMTVSETEFDQFLVVKAASNIIEIKPGRQYILVLSNVEVEEANRVQEYLRLQGISAICLVLARNVKLQVAEAPVEEGHE